MKRNYPTLFYSCLCTYVRVYLAHKIINADKLGIFKMSIFLKVLFEHRNLPPMYEID